MGIFNQNYYNMIKAANYHFFPYYRVTNNNDVVYGKPANIPDIYVTYLDGNVYNFKSIVYSTSYQQNFSLPFYGGSSKFYWFYTNFSKTYLYTSYDGIYLAFTTDEFEETIDKLTFNNFYTLTRNFVRYVNNDKGVGIIINCTNTSKYKLTGMFLTYMARRPNTDNSSSYLYSFYVHKFENVINDDSFNITIMFNFNGEINVS